MEVKLACHTITWGGVVGHPVGVTSIKDLFYLAHGPTELALADVAAAGYSGVELFDGNLIEYETPEGQETLTELLRSHKLDLVAVYSGGNFIFPEILDEELWRIRRAAALAAALGAEHLVVGGGAQRVDGLRDDDHTRLAAGLDCVVAIADDHGLRASYHPHLTTIVERREELETVLSRSRIGFCPDTAHLVAAGGDAAALVRDYADRISYVHLKDFRAEPFAFLPLGDGEIDLSAVLDELNNAGYEGWLTVELDEYHGAPGDAARRSRQHLETLLAQTR